MAENQQLLDYLKKVAGDLYETRERLRKLESGEQEPIAIVGMGCRLPGGVAAPEQLWDLLVSEGDAMGSFPTDRGWDVVEETYGLKKEDGKTAYARVGGFVYDAPDFDAGFFGISPREALAMDPQQRLLLEVSWEALEQAGIDPRSLKGSSTGVFVGANSNGYGMSLFGSDSGAEGYLLTGGLTAVISGRVSYTLGLEGPAVTVDTACSSALVALHLAYQALRAGECSMALAGGVTVMALPTGYAEFSKQQGMASDGRCKAFSADADGIGWSEGSGMVLLEKLSDARRNGHNVLAVIRGSAVNQDGASNGLSAPNGPSQQRVIKAALANARLSPADVDAVEAHGTGTSLGDPIEAQALLATYGQERTEDKPLWLGSMKSNIGHMQNASGIASVIKMVLALQGEMLPRTLHAEEPSPHIDWTAGNVRLLNEATPWPANDRPRRGGVSAFGVSGTNVHMILEEAPAPEDTPEAVEGADEEPAAPVVPVLSGSDTSAWLVSGRSAEALAGQSGRLREFALAAPELDPGDVAWSLAATRATFEHRAVIVGSGGDELTAGLAAIATGQPAAGLTSGVAPDDGAGRVVFVFPGQGSQWLGMGRELIECSPVFAARMDECAAALAPFVDWSLSDVLAGELGFEAADVVQPALWAVMVSLAAVWQAAGVAPDAVVGHSQGEIAAACVAGILSLEDAARVVALRSKALTVLAGKGGMLSIAEPADRVRERMAPYGDRVSLAAVNGPAATVVSGDPEALQELAETCTAEEVRARMIPVDYASHSAQVDALEDEIRAVLQGIAPRTAEIPMVSAMTGETLAGPELDAGYWYASLRATVEFDRAIRVLAEDGHRVFVEVSPHPVLTSAIGDTADDAGVAVSLATGTLRRDEGGPARLLTSFAEAHVNGVPVDWTRVLEPRTSVGLPTYAFQRQRYWPQSAPTQPNTEAAGGTGSAAEARFWAAVEDGDLRELADTLSINDQRLSEVLPALASWRRRERDESAVADWRYRVSWVPVSDPSSVVLSGTYLVVTPDEASAQDCVRALTERGAETVMVDAAGLDRAALAERLGAFDTGFAGVLSLLALDETPVTGFPVVPAGLAGTLTLIQALGDAGIAAPLWSVTRGAVATGPGETVTNPVQAQAWGLGLVAGLEHPDRWGGLIDLPQAWDDRAGVRLCAVLADGGEDQVAIRPAGVTARRLVRAEPRRTNAESWTPRGTALLTGATGQIGPYVARWLAGRGAERVVLTSRSGPTAEAAAAVAALAEAGTTVSFVACDLAERSQVAGLLDRIAAEGPPLKSVIHAANLGRLVSFDETGIPELSAALGAKAAGAVWLDELTADLDLDAFVLFSSIAATWGSVDHGAYATGNAFLDALAQRRRSRGLRATSVAWGVWDTRDWAEVEASVSHAPGALTPARLRRQGMEFLDPQRALLALDQALLDDDTFVAIADVDWDAFAPVYRAVRPWPLLSQIPEVVLQSAVSVSAHTAVTGQEGELASRLSGLAPDERQLLTVDLVRSHAAAVLGHGSADAVSADRAFRDLGFDSLTAVELRNRLNTATGLSLPSTVVFDYPSATVLAAEVVRRLVGASQPVGAQPVVVTLDPAEPIAIVGMGCRFPGGAHSPQSLWDLLASGGDAVSGFPTDRGWDMAGLFDPDPDNPGTSYVQEGGFLHAAADFDASFFGISPREALAMDPQQRLLLEVSWEALERAGIDPESMQGSATGVFAGAAPSGYAGQVVGIEGAEGHLITGNVGSVLSGRISYTLGLEGPAVTVDTACSSSLVALHLAAQALRTGECSMALAGGVMVIAEPGEFIGFSRQRVLAADGRCKAFSADADGMGIAEGAGMVLLERLSDAQRNGHNVLAVIRGSAINQDGASNGLTAPNGPSQQRVINAALANAGLSATDIDAVEAHGTGTALGDPIEAQALIATYGQDRPADRPLWLGSVKSNIGHAQQAAGVAGVIKMVLALRNNALPATLFADVPSPHVDWSADTVRLLSEHRDWPSNGRPRRAGVSAFGISGTNGHVILEEAPPLDAPDEEPAPPVLSGSETSAWLVSGRTAEGLASQAGRLREFALGSDLGTKDVAWSLAATRSVFEHRAVIVGTGREELTAGLSAVATGQSGPVSGAVRASARVGFVFSGQGSQRAGMGAGLYAASPVFAEAFDRVCGLLEAELGLPVADVVLGRTEPDIGADATLFAQTGLFAFQVGAVSLLKAAGVSPAAVAGHSVGEFAAAWAAGVLSLEDAARLVATRARLMQALPEGGAMWAIAAPEAEVLASIDGVEGVSIAAVNGPASTVLSGDAEAVETVAETWRSGGTRVRRLRVSHAFHSHLMDPVLDELGQVASGLAHHTPRIPWACGTTGEALEEFGSAYWVEQARGAVRFADAVSTLSGRGVNVFVEIGPDGTLSGMGPAVVADGVFVPVSRPKTAADVAVLEALGRVHVSGGQVDWRAVFTGGRLVELPTYAFQHQRFWPESSQAADAVAVGGGAENPADAEFWAAIENGDVRQVADTLAVDDDRVGDLLPALASWRRRSLEDSAVADWRYQVTWAQVPEPGSTVLSGTWLVVTPDEDLARDCVQALSERGAETVLFEAADQLERAALAERLTPLDGVTGVVSLLAFGEGPVAATLALVQALGDAGVAAPMWAVTRGAVATGLGDAAPDPALAQIWGLGRVAALEHPDRWGGLVDLPPTWDGRTAARLCGILTGTGEDQVAIRPSGIMGRRLVRAAQPRTGTAWTPGGSVLITGGTGGIGGQVALWAAGRRAQRVVLTSRSGPGAAGVGALAAELAAAGTSVDVIAGDISQRSEVEGLLARIGADGPPLSSVVHAAGVGEAKAIEEFTPADLLRVSAVKTAGAVLLDELTQAMDLDAFVVFSSVSATWGSGLQPGYAAANSFLDALVEDRRSRGLAGTSLAWGLWGGAGMGAGTAGEHLQRYGLRLMDPVLGIRAMAQAVDAGEVVVAVADVDWARFAPTFTLRRPSPLIETLPEVRQALAGPVAPAASAAESTSGLAQRLTGLSRVEQDRLLIDLIRTEASSVLGYASADAVESDRAFSDLGFDSLTAVELRGRLSAATGLSLPTTLVFDYPTAAILAEHLLGEMLGLHAASGTPVPEVTAAVDGEPIAIVGMSCRLPGGVASPEQLWDLVAAGTDAISAFPEDRGWDVHDPALGDPSGSYARVGGFVHDATNFDAGFFGISPREALAMDPQQRLLLEVSWEALERAGIAPSSLRRSVTGVFAGAASSGYDIGLLLSADDERPEGHVATGNAGSVISGRIAYAFGLEGPAVTVDTACSSSMVALHLACQALRSGECTMALAGGVTVMATPGAFGEFSKQQGMSADGRCKPFSDDADGTGWAEGAGVLVVERLSDARRNGHNVLAVIRGSAVNQDGASNGLTAPNGPSQQRVIRAALANARLSASDVDAVEAHGTGTTLGDPIEAQALLATYGRDRTEDQPLWLGSVKSNIGHPQSAAGVAGIIKMVLAMRHGVLPRTLHADVPSTHVDWSAGTVRLLNEALPWPSTGRPRRAGVSAFGMSGTNAHVILEQSPEDDTETPEAVEPDVPVLSESGTSAWLVSARGAEALAGQAGRLREFALAATDLDPRDVAWSLAATRSTFENRAVVVGSGREELAAGLAAVATGQPATGVTTGAASDGAGRTVFVFPGQGSQWLGMGRDLAETSPVFAARLNECAAALAPFVDWSLHDVLAGELGFEAADVVQPALWAVMVSLAAVWEAAGVKPDAVVGHSQGEIAAACVSGILSLQDAARVVALRSKALTVLAGEGGMLSIAEPADRVRERIADLGDRASVAAVNGPAATVVSGEPQVLQDLAETCEAEGVRARMIPVDYASHSAQVDALEDDIRSVLEGISPRAARIPMVSAMSGETLAGPELDAAYWYASLRATVEFDRAIRVLAEDGHRSFIEVSPHPVLTGAITDTLDDAGTATALVTGTLRRDEGGPARLLTSLAEAHVNGVRIDWTAILEPGGSVDLPTYAFQHQRFWPRITPVTGPATPGSAAEAEFWAAVESGDVRQVADTLAVDGDRLGGLLPALAAWRRREQDDSLIADWRYRVSWVPVPDAGSVVLSGTWLVVTPDEASASECVRALADRGSDAIVVEAGPETDRAALIGRIATALDGTDRTRLSGVLSLLALDVAPLAGHPVVPAGLAATTFLVQALADAEITAPIWAVTRGAVSTGPGDPLTDPIQAQTWGLGRVAALEIPDGWGGLIDLPPSWDERSASRLCAVLAGTGEDQVAIRPSGILARRLVRAPLSPSGRSRWTSDGTALVTGGTGAIGGNVSRWLAGRGVARLVLSSRSGPQASGVARLAAELATAGASVEVVACDIAQRNQVGELLARIAADGPPLTAVMHAAGVARGGPVLGIGPDDLAEDLAAKATGAAWLDELTRDLDLDAFVLFSSGAATWGSGVLAGYAAANAFLDAVAERRRAAGLAATSVAWGLWGGGGMVSGDIGEQLLRYGMRVMDPASGILALAQSLDNGDGVITVADVDWERFAPTFALRRRSPLIDSLPEVRAALAGDDAADDARAPESRTELGRRLASLSEIEQRRTLTDLVRAEGAAVLGHSSSDAVPSDRAFKDLGFDSLSAVELRNRLNTTTGLRLSSTLVFDYPTAAVLAEHLRSELLGVRSGSAPAAPVTAAVDGEPIAIVGMGCRLPGGVFSPEQLWDLLASGTDGVSGFPSDRGWDVAEAAYLAEQGDVDMPIARVGGFVYDATKFDAGFFGVSPREALAMDPQQRMLLEVSWETLERAGFDPASLRGSATGVFAGATYSGYGDGLGGGDNGSEGYLLTGALPAVISGRVSYTLGLEGPAVTVDTACSSALVALHLACQSLRSGECTMALAGGVAVMATPGAFAEFTKQQGMAADGRCKAFSDDADGMGWAEGAAMLLVERLSDAQRNGHNVLAVIRGSAMNQDGASNGLTAPNGPSQQRVIRAALANARLSASDVDAVEAHGTGTTLGDPIEAQALLATYGQERTDGQPLWLGSVKSNIGHPQAAAGAVGVIKMVLALQGEVLPRTLHADEPSAQIDWTAGNVRLLNEALPWPANGRPRRAGVSAFGVSGTNVHVILEEAPAPEDTEVPGEQPAVPVLSGSGTSAWPVSARSAESLAGQAGRLREFALANPELGPGDVAWSLAATRSTFENRAVVVGSGREELAAGLAAVATGQPATGVTTGVASSDGVGRTVFVFPGQGSQWLGMGRELAECSPVFAARLKECAEALAPFVDWSLDDVLAGDLGFETADVVQPALWAVMVSLAAVWEAAGVAPDAVVGHSQGEIAAACVAGILSLEDSARVVALRSKALTVLAGKGGMLSVAEPADRVRERMVPFGDRVSLAAVNGPAATVVSGDPEALQELAELCTAEEVRARLIPVDYASHSAQVDALEDDILQVLEGITPGPARIAMVSAMTGEMLAGPELDAGYWYASLRATVEFDRAVRVLAEGGHRAFVEVSPHPVLTGAITDTLESADSTASLVTGTLRRDEGGPARLLASLAEAHVNGVRIDWTSVLERGTPTELPTYAFQRQRFWPDAGKPAVALAGDAENPADAEFWAAVEDGDVRRVADTLAVDGDQVSELLPALAAWRRRERDDSAVANWRYRVSWVPVSDNGQVVLAGTWLLAVAAGRTEDALVQDCARVLAERGAEVTVLEVGADDLDRTALTGRLAALGGAPFAGVVSLVAFDETPLTEFPAVPAGAAGTLLLVQALGDAGITAPLWSITQGAVATGFGETVTNPVQAQVWGLGQVAGLENPDRWGGLIDLPQVWDDRTVIRLCAVLADGGEDQVAIRPAGVVARRVVRAEPRRAGNESWTPRGTALLTGATGQIGPHLGRWLAGRGVERLVLTSRSGPSAALAAAVAAVAESGTAVSMLACDIAERSQVAGILDRIASDGPPLKTVIHAANAGRMVSFDETGIPELSAALGAKASGAVWLDELTADLDLDAFVLFSSIAATWGSAEHAAYAAGNAFLDALARRRRSRGLPATSVAWGVWDTRDWAEVEAASSQAPGSVTPVRLRRQGMTFQDPERAVTALEQVLADDETFIAVADVDWVKFVPVYRAMRAWPLLDQIPEARQPIAAAHAAEAGQAGELAARLANETPDERRRIVVELVRSHAAAVLGHGSADAVSADRAFRDLGFDSLTAVELRNRLNAATGLILPSTVVFDYPSATTLATEVISRLVADARPAEARPVVISVDPAEPIAVVGMGCRFPGGVASPEQLWELLVSGGDAVSGFPTDRGWDMAGLFDPDPDNPGTSYVQEGGFLHGAAEFDASFFGISPREALAMDPQQRLLLEVAWEALERAGIDPESLKGSMTGVFAGAASSGYLHQGAGMAGSEGHLITGNVASVLSGRISYTLGLEGPAVTLDTACSSSLVALHLAAQALRTGECSMALAGGVMVMSDPAEFVGFSRQRVLAADGRCKAFSADADGMGIAEGAGMVLLERLSDAQRNGHRVLAVVAGSAINQDGASNGLTAPNGPSQQRVIKAALAGARLSAADVDVVEAHGTGTKLGDPIEAQALIATYGQDRPADRPLWLGTVKSNIGHAQQAAGIAGVIKMVLALQHGALPATLFADAPSPHVDWSADTVRLLTEHRDWPSNGRPRRAGVSAFGISGTNAHVVLEEPPVIQGAVAGEIVEPAEALTPVLSGSDVSAWPVSGRSAEALAGQAGRLREFALAAPELDPRDVAWSLATTRSTFEHRAVVIGSGREELAAGLAAAATGRPAANVLSGTTTSSGPGRTVFVFPGQGSQWLGMGRELADASPVFAARLNECAAALAPFVDWSLHDVLAGKTDFEAADVVQPALWAVMVSLAAVWQAAGVKPDAVVGHSQGEIAAACVAGILSLEDSARVVALRSKALTVLAGKGGMLSIAEPADRVRERLAPYGDRASVAAVNGPSATVVSGEPSALRELAETCTAEEVRARMIPVDYASHSAQVDALEDDILKVLAGVTPGPARVPMISAMSGEMLTGPELDAGYWYASLRSPVEFDGAIRTLAESGSRVFIEASPHPVLTGAITDTLDAVDVAASLVTGTLRRDEGGPARLLASLAEAHVNGVRIDWTSVLERGTPTELPTYAFQHERFWPEASQAAAEVTAVGEAEAEFWDAVENGDVDRLADGFAMDGRRPLSEALPALAAWRRRSREDSAVADWRYGVSWTQVPEPGPAVLSGTWLVVAPEGVPAQRYVEALTERGAETVVVELDETDRAALAGRLTGMDGLAGVLSLLAFGEGPVAATLALVQALGDAGSEVPVWAVTQGAISTGPGDALTDPAQAQVWGLGRVAALEHPERWGGLVDLPQTWDGRTAARFCGILAGTGEDQVAIRPSGIMGRRLVRAAQPRTSTTWKPGGTVLVTGGTGGIGGHVADWAAERGARRVVLTSRSGPAAAGVGAQAARLAAAGTRVDVVACDIADRSEVEALLAGIAVDGPPLSSVVHSAGVGEAKAIEEFTPADLVRVSAVKVDGAMVLDELTRSMDLDAFVVFSSVSAIWGSGLQPGYAAANAFLDAMVEDRRSRGLVGTSLAWGLWDGGGMGAGMAGEQLQRYGLRLMDPALGIRAMAQAVDAGELAVAVADVDWARFAPTFTLRRSSPLIEALPEVREALASPVVPVAAADSGSDLVQRLTGLAQAEQDRILIDIIRTEAAAALGFASPDAMEATRAFRDLGFESVTAVELRNRLNAATGLRLPSTLVFDYPNPAVLAEHLRSQLLPDGASGPASVLDELSRLEAGLADLASDPGTRNEVTMRLRGMLSRWIENQDTAEPEGDGVAFDDATHDEVFDFLDNELGLS